MNGIPSHHQHPRPLKTRRSHCVYVAVDLVDVVARLMDFIIYLSISATGVYIVPVWSHEISIAREWLVEIVGVCSVKGYQSVC